VKIFIFSDLVLADPEFRHKVTERAAFVAQPDGAGHTVIKSRFANSKYIASGNLEEEIKFIARELATPETVKYGDLPVGARFRTERDPRMVFVKTVPVQYDGYLCNAVRITGTAVGTPLSFNLTADVIFHKEQT